MNVGTNNNAKTSLKMNFMMNFILTMSSFLFPLITFPYISRILLAEGIGKVSFATSLISYFNMFAQLGIPTYGIRACAKVRDNKEELTRTVHELLLLNICLSIGSYIVLLFLIITVPRLQTDKLLYILISMSIILSAIGMEWLYKALEQYTYITIRSMIFKFIALIAMFLLIHNQKDYIIYGVVSIFASSASNITNFFNARKYISWHFVGHYNIKRHLRATAIFFAMACATTVYINIDTVMLGFMKTDADVGYYSAAIKIRNILVSIVTSLGTVLLPRASYYIENNLILEFKRISKKSMNFVFLLALPLITYFMLFAKQGIMLISGDGYSSAVLPMKLLMPTLIFIGMTNIIGIQILVPVGKEKIVLYSEIWGAIVDLVLNAILIPRIASTGAAIATLAAEVIVFAVQFKEVRKVIPEIFEQIRILRVGCALFVGVVSSIWISYIELSNFLILLFSATTFFTFYVISLIIMKETLTIEILKQLSRLVYHKNSKGCR